MNPDIAQVLDAVADSYNPLLALLALLAPVLPGSREPLRVARYFVAGGLGIAWVYLLRAAGERFLLWPALGLEYSTHSAFAASLVVSLSILRRAWLLPLAVSLALYYLLALGMRYHGPLDLMTAGALSALLTWAAHLVLRTRSRQLDAGPQSGSVPS